MTLKKVGVSPFRAVHVIAYCNLDCGFSVEWNPPASKLAEAKRHTRETGHMVAVDETRISNITLAESAPKPEREGDG